MSAQLWIPGPTQVRPELLEILSEPMIGHRTPDMRAAIHALDPHLERALGVRAGGAGEGHRVAVHSCTATGLMEMALRATGRRVLSLVNGSFSRRFAEVARSVGHGVVEVESPLGSPADLRAAAEILRTAGPFDAITVCASETSTGALTPPLEIGRALADRDDACLLVDAVTLLGASELHAGEAGLDFVFGGTQKALALPPGLGVYAVSERMLGSAAGRPNRGFFLDLVRITEAHAKAAPPMTPTLSLIRALRAQLEAITDGSLEGALWPEGADGGDGWSRRFDRHAAMRATTAAWAKDEGLAIEGDGGETSPTVSCVRAEGYDLSAFLADMADQGFLLGSGYGPLRDTTFRIGHMGDHTPAALHKLLAAAGKSLPRHRT